jgi:hypothetical protein
VLICSPIVRSWPSVVSALVGAAHCAAVPMAAFEMLGVVLFG